MRLYEERLRMLRKIEYECYDTFNAGDCENCLAFERRKGGCYLGRPMYWRTDAIRAKKSTQRGGNRN